MGVVTSMLLIFNFLLFDKMLCPVDFGNACDHSRFYSTFICSTEYSEKSFKIQSCTSWEYGKWLRSEMAISRSFRFLGSSTSTAVLFICGILCIVYLSSERILSISRSQPNSQQQFPGNFLVNFLGKTEVINKNINRAVTVKSTPERAQQRQAMEPCEPVYGRVGVLVAAVTSSYQKLYRVAQDSLKCYLKSTNYTFILVDLNTDERVNQQCDHNQLFFKKHCAALAYLRDFDWLLVLDADTGVVNPNHCIEEWIDPRVSILFYERFFNWEIASGNYLIRNDRFARDFLKKWADWQYEQPQNWNGADNGVLQIHILQSVLPEARNEIQACDKIWHKGSNYDTYMAYVTCVKVFLGAGRLWPQKIRILRRGHAWVRDGYLTGDKWSRHDFMLHGWKLNRTETEGWQSPFSRMFNVNECGVGEKGWHWRAEYRVTGEEIRKSLAHFEASAAKNFPKQAQYLPYLSETDVADCWPHCDDYV